MADDIFFQHSRREERRIPLRYVRDEQRRRQKKTVSPKGMSSLVNFFLSLRLRTAVRRTHCSLELTQI